MVQCGVSHDRNESVSSSYGGTAGRITLISTGVETSFSLRMLPGVEVEKSYFMFEIVVERRTARSLGS